MCCADSQPLKKQDRDKFKPLSWNAIKINILRTNNGYSKCTLLKFQSTEVLGAKNTWNESMNLQSLRFF